MTPDVDAIASRLIAAWDGAAQIAPIAAGDPGFDVAAGYQVLHEIERRRRAQGWISVGRKIGFTNRTIWSRYGVFQPMWAHVWAHTVHFVTGRAGQRAAGTLPLAGFAEPRIEPEVVFKLAGPVPITDDPEAVLAAIEWMAPGFEIVQSHFPAWKFAAADCTAAFGLHGALVVGPPLALIDVDRAEIASLLSSFTLTLRRAAETVDVGVGANVLDSPALALVHLARVVAQQPQFPPLAAGEIVTTGTVTDAWPVRPGETWSSDYGALPLAGMELTFAEPNGPSRSPFTQRRGASGASQ